MVFVLAMGPVAAPAAEDAAAAPAATLLTINYPPLSYYEHGELTGFAVDIVRAAMRRAGLSGVLEMAAFADVLDRAGKTPGAAVFPLSRVPSREGRFRWVGPLFMEEIALYASKDAGVRPAGIEEARHVRGIAVVRGYASGRHLRDLGFANLVEFDYPSQCAEALSRGGVDLWLSSSVAMASLARQADVDPAQLEKILAVAEFPAYLAFSRATAPEYVQRFAQAPVHHGRGRLSGAHPFPLAGAHGPGRRPPADPSGGAGPQPR